MFDNSGAMGIVMFAVILFIGICLIISSSANEQKTDSVYKITEMERETLARLVYLEAGTCGRDCQRAVASVVFNRLGAGHWGDTLSQVIYYPNAFTTASLIADCEKPPKSAYEAVDYVIENGSTVPAEVMYFRTDYDFDWEGYTHYKTYDNVYFGYFTNGNH